MIVNIERANSKCFRLSFQVDALFMPAILYRLRKFMQAKFKVDVIEHGHTKTQPFTDDMEAWQAAKALGRAVQWESRVPL